MRSSESSLSSDDALSATAKDRSSPTTERWKKTVSHQHFVLGLTEAFFVIARDAASSHHTLVLIFGMELTESSSTTRVCNWSVAGSAESNVTSASSDSSLSAPWKFTRFALDCLDFVFFDFAAAKTRLANARALVIKLVELWSLPLRGFLS